MVENNNIINNLIIITKIVQMLVKISLQMQNLIILNLKVKLRDKLNMMIKNLTQIIHPKIKNHLLLLKMS